MFPSDVLNYPKFIGNFQSWLQYIASFYLHSDNESSLLQDNLTPLRRHQSLSGYYKGHSLTNHLDTNA